MEFGGDTEDDDNTTKHGKDGDEAREDRRIRSGECKVNDDNENELPPNARIVRPEIQAVFHQALALVAAHEDRPDLKEVDNNSKRHSMKTPKNDSRHKDVGDDDKIVVEEEHDDDDDDTASTSSDKSDTTEVTNNKSVVSGPVDLKSAPRLSGVKQLTGSLSGHGINLDEDSQSLPSQRKQKRQQKPRQPEPASTADALPFKGNPSTQRRLEKEKRREQRRLNKKLGVPANLVKDDDQEFDLCSKPGFIHVVEEHEEYLLGEEEHSHGTSPSRKTTTTAGNTTHTSSSSSSSSFTLTEERIQSHMKDYYEDYDSIFRYGKTSKECWEAFFRQYFTDDVTWVRSTGNPLGREGLAKLLADDIVGVSMSIVSIDSIQLLAGGLAAVVVFTADQEYSYRGVRECDRTVITSVLHVVKGCEILIGHEHRCVGKPIPKDTRWES